MPIFDNGRIFVLRFRKLFDEYGTSRKALAEITGKSETNISHYLAGRIQPDLRNLCKIAEFYNVSTDYLLGLSNTREKREDTWGKDVVETTRMLINDDFCDIDTLVNLMNEVARAIERKARK